MSRILRDWGIALLVGVLVFFLANWLGGRTSGPMPPTGQLAPDFALINLAGGTTRLSESRGRTTVINFWATWCGPCKAELPEFTAYAKEHPEITVLGVVVPRSEGARLPEIVARFRIGYPVLVADDTIERNYPIDAFPTTYVVRADGTIADIQMGGMDREMLGRMVIAAGG